jgi:hypothetical protein
MFMKYKLCFGLAMCIPGCPHWGNPHGAAVDSPQKCHLVMDAPPLPFLIPGIHQCHHALVAAKEDHAAVEIHMLGNTYLLDSRGHLVLIVRLPVIVGKIAGYILSQHQVNIF